MASLSTMACVPTVILTKTVAPAVADETMSHAVGEEVAALLEEDVALRVTDILAVCLSMVFPLP